MSNKVTALINNEEIHQAIREFAERKYKRAFEAKDSTVTMTYNGYNGSMGIKEAKVTLVQK